MGWDIGILVNKGKVESFPYIWIQHQLFRAGIRKRTYKQMTLVVQDSLQSSEKKIRDYTLVRRTQVFKCMVRDTEKE